MLSNYSDEQISPIGVPRYLIATPYWGAIDADHLDCVFSLLQLYPELGQRQQRYRVRGCAYIDIARATAAQFAIDGGYAGLFFIDHDVVFDPRDVIAMMREAERERTIVYGAYSMRRGGDRMVGTFSEAVKRATFFRGGGLYPGKDGGLGFAAIPRHVLEAVGKDMPLLRTGFSKAKPLFALKSGFPDWPELYDRLISAGVLDLPRDEFAALVTELAGGWYAGEDISFFARAARAGFAPLLDTRPKLGHVGSYRYGLEDVQIVVPRGESLEVQIVHCSDPDAPVAQQLLAAGAPPARVDGAAGPLVSGVGEPAARQAARDALDSENSKAAAHAAAE